MADEGVGSPHQRAKDVFLAALAQPAGGRQAFLAEACGTDTALRAEVESLLDFHEDSQSDAAPATPRHGLAAPRDRFAPGHVFADRYRMVTCLGRGGMGEVWRADDLVLETPVALKFLHATGPAARARGLLEVRLARQVTHPAVCRVFDVGEADGEVFFSMELVRGETLATLLTRAGRLASERVVDIGRQLCLGLAAAHAHGVLHRDLKPANILIDDVGLVRITDFGIAVTRADAARDPRVGTPGYMAPEQLRSDAGVTEQTDLYAIGLVLYELVVGRHPFNRSDASGPPLRPATLVPDVHPELERAILQALAVSPRDRPASALAMAALLPSDTRDRPPAAGPATPWQHAAGAGPAALPMPRTRLIGRALDVTAGGALLARSRVVTLTGPGGSGKTRLAIEIATGAAARFPGGITWIELGSLPPSQSPAEYIAVTIGLREHGTRSTLDTLAAQFDRLPGLLVLDNCEHLVAACAELVDGLLRQCPALTILATSREALGVDGERTWLVQPLPLPDAGASGRDGAMTADAVQLFLDRAQAAHADFELTDGNASAVVRICRRLDGIPLAIELAAARVGVLSPGQIADRLDTNFDLLTAGGRRTLARHGTLGETIAWSYKLLTPREQRLLCRLSVFSGPCALAWVEAVCTDDEIPRPELLDVLAGLLEKSMVMREARGTEMRYRLLEAVRHFARGQLEAAGETERWQARHAEWFAQLAEAIAPRLFAGAADPELVASLLADLDEFNVASDWATRDPQRAEIAVRIASAINWLWFCCGRFREGERRLATALAHAGDLDPLVRARGLSALGTLSFWQGSLAAARGPLEQAVTGFRRCGDPDPESQAWALSCLGGVELGQGQVDKALKCCDGAAALLDSSNASMYLGPLEYWRGQSREAAGDRAGARQSFERALAISRAQHHRPGIAHQLFVLGRLDAREGHPVAARARFAEALRIFHEIGDRWGECHVFGAFGAIAASDEDDVRAIRLFAAADTLRTSIGVERPNGGDVVAATDAVTARTAPEAFDAAWREGASMTIDDAFAYALSTDHRRDASPRDSNPRT